MKIIKKLSLPATILIASLILGGFFYASQVNKQQSIERQQEVKLQEDRRIEEAKTGQENKEYIAKRKLECYGIYEKERDKWNNVDGSFYREEDDVCVVRYVDDDWKEGDPIFSGLFDADDDGIKETYSAGKYFTKEY